MALPTEVTPTITGRGAVSIVFYIPDPDDTEDVQAGKLTCQIKFNNGDIKERTYDLLEHLTDDSAGTNTHLPALLTLKTYILDRIDSEVLS